MNTLKKVLLTYGDHILFSKLTVISLLLCLGMAASHDLYAQQPSVELHWSPSNPQPEDEVTVSFTMGTFENQASDIYNINESFSYADSAFQLSSGIQDTITLNNTGSWFANDQNWSGYMLVDSANKKIILQMSRPSNDPRSGYATLASGGEVVVVIEEVLFKKAYPTTFQANIYPNPSQGKLSIESLDGNPIKDITVINMAGQSVRSVTVNQSVFKMDLSDLPNQVYLLKIEGSNGNMANYRWIKQ